MIESQVCDEVVLPWMVRMGLRLSSPTRRRTFVDSRKISREPTHHHQPPEDDVVMVKGSLTVSF